MSVSPTTTWTRPDLGMQVNEFNTELDRQGFIGHRVLPIVLRGKDQGDYPKRSLETLLRQESTDRNPDGTYPRSDSKWEDDTYKTKERAHEGTVDDRSAKKFDDIIDAEADEVERVTDIVLRSYERAVAAAVFNTTTWTGATLTTAVGTAWSDTVNSNPISDVEAAREKLILGSGGAGGFGQEPNALIINRKVLRNLKDNEKIIDRLKGQNFQDARKGNINAEMIAVALDIPMVIVAGSVDNTANEAKARSLSRIWSPSYAMLAKVAETDNPAEACLGRTVMWSEEGAVDGDRYAVIVEQYRENRRRGGVMRVRSDDDIKIQFAAAGHLLTNISA